MADRAQDRQAVAVGQAEIEDQGGITDRRQGGFGLAGGRREKEIPDIAKFLGETSPK